MMQLLKMELVGGGRRRGVTEDNTHSGWQWQRRMMAWVDAEFTDSAGRWRTGSADGGAGGGGRLAVKDEDTTEGGGGRRGRDTFFFFVIMCFVRPVEPSPSLSDDSIGSFLLCTKTNHHNKQEMSSILSMWCIENKQLFWRQYRKEWWAPSLKALLCLLPKFATEQSMRNCVWLLLLSCLFRHIWICCTILNTVTSTTLSRPHSHTFTTLKDKKEA